LKSHLSYLNVDYNALPLIKLINSLLGVMIVNTKRIFAMFLAFIMIASAIWSALSLAFLW